MVALKKLFLCLFFGYSCLLPVHAAMLRDDLFPLYKVKTLEQEGSKQQWASGSLTPEQIEQRSEESSGYRVYIPHCIERDVRLALPRK